MMVNIYSEIKISALINQYGVYMALKKLFEIELFLTSKLCIYAKLNCLK